MSDGYVEGQNLICGVHGWDYRLDTGVSDYNNDVAFYRFSTIIDDDTLYVDEDEINHFLKSGTHLSPPRVEEIQQVILQHLNCLYDFF